MPRLMSVAFTEDAVRNRTKTVTRRKGWWKDKNGRRIVRAGDRIILCRKIMGRKPGEPLVRIAEVEVVDVRREVLASIGKCGCWDKHAQQTYAEVEVASEGFPGMDPEEFIRRFFVEAQGMTRDDLVTRIEWRYLPELHGGVE